MERGRQDGDPGCNRGWGRFLIVRSGTRDSGKVFENEEERDSYVDI